MACCEKKSRRLPISATGLSINGLRMKHEIRLELRGQRGAVLVVSLIILLVLTLLSIATARSTLMQEKMTAAVNDTHISLQAAELGMLSAEAYIETLVSTAGFSSTGTGGLYKKDNSPEDLFAAATWGATKVRSATTSPIAGSVPVATYYIEELGAIDEAEVAGGVNLMGYGQSSGTGNITGFRVVVRGVGRSPTSERVLASYYGKRL